MMSKFKKNLQLQTEDVKLSAGDMIIDHTLNSRGFLVKRKRYIDIIEDDIYVWEINWFKHDEEITHGCPAFLEEEGLKLSIVVGTVELYNKDGEYYVPDYVFKE